MPVKGESVCLCVLGRVISISPVPLSTVAICTRLPNLLRHGQHLYEALWEKGSSHCRCWHRGRCRGLPTSSLSDPLVRGLHPEIWLEPLDPGFSHNKEGGSQTPRSQRSPLALGTAWKTLHFLHGIWHTLVTEKLIRLHRYMTLCQCRVTSEPLRSIICEQKPGVPTWVVERLWNVGARTLLGRREL